MKATIESQNTIASNSFQPLLNEFDLAKLTNLSVASLRRWRLLAQGPRFIKLGNSVRYRPEDVKAWIDSRQTGGETSGK